MMNVEDSFKDEFAVLFFYERCIYRTLNTFLYLLLCRFNRQKFVRINVIHCHLHVTNFTHICSISLSEHLFLYPV